MTKKYEIEQIVETPDGFGIIKDKDLPSSKYWRWVVRLKNGLEACYFESELKAVFSQEEFRKGSVVTFSGYHGQRIKCKVIEAKEDFRGRICYKLNNTDGEPSLVSDTTGNSIIESRYFGLIQEFYK